MVLKKLTKEKIKESVVEAGWISFSNAALLRNTIWQLINEGYVINETQEKKIRKFIWEGK